jgi:hypothetical protein
MIESKAAVIIRTVYNNNGWAGPCKKPISEDSYKCYKCVKGEVVGVNGGEKISEDNNGYCIGEIGSIIPGDKWCWEQTLCSNYFWRNLRGQWRYATVGMPVYFVYTEYDGSLTLWAETIIDEIDNEHDYPTLKFRPFDPLPKNKRVTGLTGEKLTGKSWRQGAYRYPNENHKNYIASLLLGESIDAPTTNLSPAGYKTINLKLKNDIRNKLIKIANDEGRELDDLIREALAKLIRERGL